MARTGSGDGSTRTRWQRLLPFLAWPRPTATTLRSDAWAGASVAVVVVPQALAYATLAGMPPATGLYAALLPSIVGVLWGSMPLLSIGPVALTSLLTFASLQPLAPPGSAEWIALAIWLAVYSGAIQILLGAFRLGLIANFVSYPVMTGFLHAAALIIIVSQVPALLSLPAGFDSTWLARAAATVRDAPWRVAETAAFGLGALGLLLLQRRVAPRLPGVLIVCIVGIAASIAIGYERHGLAVVGTIPPGLPAFGAFPSLALEQHRALLAPAIIIALISFTEAMSSGQTLARRRDEPWNENQELIGQGLAKIASGASGGFPVSSSLSRSALNAQAGAASGWSTMFAAAFVAAFLVWGTGYLYPLPRAILAAMIVVPVVGLLDFGVFRSLWRTSRDDGGIAMTTFAATLVAVPYVHWGVLTGFVLSLLFYLYRRARPRLIEVGPHPDGTLRDRDVHGLPPIADDVLAVRMDAAVTYLNAPLLERFVSERVQRSARVRTVLICCTPMNDIDATGVDMLRRLQRALSRRGVALRMSGVKKQVHDVLARTGVVRDFGEAAFYTTDRAAIDALARSDQETIA